MDTFQMLRGARKIVEQCIRVRSGERVVVVTDTTLADLADVMAGAAEQVGAEVVVTIMRSREFDGAEPPSVVASAMADAHASILLVDRSIAHTAAIRNALKAGTRALSMTGFNREMFARGGINTDFEDLKPLCESMASQLGYAASAHLTSRAGTDLRMSLEGRSGNAHACIVDTPGTIAGVPNIEANIAPVEGMANGTIVVDGSIPNLRRGVLHEPVELQVEDGFVTDIRGGHEATIISSIAKQQGSIDAFNVAQLAIGLNPHCTAFTGEFQNDHGAYGTVHIGIGSSVILGGTTDIPFHFDGMMHQPTLWLDGRPVLEAGQVTGRDG